MKVKVGGWEGRNESKATCLLMPTNTCDHQTRHNSWAPDFVYGYYLPCLSTMSPSSPTPSCDSAADPSDPYTNLPSDTHAERHPAFPRQEVRVLTKTMLSETQKATHALRLASDKEKNALLMTDLKSLLTTQHEELINLAKKHAVKVEYLSTLPPPTCSDQR